MRNRFACGSFSADELIMIADFVGCQLAFEIDDAQKVLQDGLMQLFNASHAK